MSNKLKGMLIFIALVLVSLILRLLAVDYGLPHLYTTDEGFEVDRALKLGAGVFDFSRVLKGGYFYILFFEYSLIYILLRVLDTISSAQDFVYLYYANPTVFWLPGRVTSAILGAFSCGLLFLLGRRAFGNYVVGIIAATLLAFHWDHVRATHLISIDAPLVATVIASFLVMLWHQDNSKSNNYRVYTLLAVLIAFATMTRLQAALLLIPLLIFHIRNVRASYFTRPTVKQYLLDHRFLLLTGLGMSLYIAGNPGIVILFGEILQWITASFMPDTIVQAPAPEFPIAYEDRSSNLSFYWNALFPPAYIGLAIFTIIGLGFAFVRPRYRDLCFLGFAVPFFLMLVAFQGEEHVYGRYLRPIVPIIWLYTAYGALCCGQFLYQWSPSARLVVPTFFLIALSPMVWDTATYLWEANKPDTRTAAYEWFKDIAPAGSTVYLEGTGTSASTVTLPLNMSPEFLVNQSTAVTTDTINPESNPRDMRFKQRLRFLKTTTTYKLIPIYNTSLMTQALDEQRGDFVILRDSVFPPFEISTNRERFPKVYQLLQWTNSNDFELIRSFSSGKKYSGPNLLIFQRTH